MSSNKESNQKKNNWYFVLQEYYFVIIPIIITLLLYSISLPYEFRNFDEDSIIKNFYVKKTFGEYIEKYLLCDWSGITQAQGFTFSSIKNVHFCILERPAFYLVNFLFQAKPFLFHIWSLALHLLVVYFFTLFSYKLSQNKEISLFSGLIWSLHPTNVEPIIWATNWPALIGAIFYFYTLYKVASTTNEQSIQYLTVFISIMATLQILFIEHTITIPAAIFLTVLFQLKKLKNLNNNTNILKSAIKTSLPSFIIVFIYWVLRSSFIDNNLNASTHNGFTELIKRLVYFTPQTFVHQLKLVLFPNKLTIDQLDLLVLDKTFFGNYHLFCIAVLILFLYLSISLWNHTPYLSFGLLLYFIGVSPFLQIIPLYSLVTERYNYFGLAFFVFGIICTLFNWLKNKKKLLLSLLVIASICLGGRSFFRIIEWGNSSTLFLSTINTSNSLFKKGIWTYNLAISQQDENKKRELLNLSTNLLKLFIQNLKAGTQLTTSLLNTYELDNNSTLAKAALRIATNYEILNQPNEQFEYLLKALKFSRVNTQIKSLVYKNLGTLYFQKNDFSKALFYYKKSNLISPNPTLTYAIAACYLKLQDFSNYEKYLQQSIDRTKYSTSAPPFKAYGQLLELTKKDYKNAIKYYKIASLLENSPEPYILLGTLYLKQNQIQKAFEIINNGLVGFSENPTLLYLHGTILLNKKKVEAGIKELIKVADKTEATKDIKMEACNILVNIFSNEGNLKEAKKYNDFILMLDPKNQEALNRLMVR